MKVLNWVSLILVIIGSLNWLLIGIFDVNLVAKLFDNAPLLLEKIIYILVGLAGIYLLINIKKFAS